MGDKVRDGPVEAHACGSERSTIDVKDEAFAIGKIDGDLLRAVAPMSIALTLEDELDISRGDILVAPDSAAVVTNNLTASLVWMDEQPLELNRRYLLKHTSRTVHAVVKAVDYRLDVATLEHQSASTLTLNGIGVVEIESVQPLAVDRYSSSRITGSFVLIDPVTNETLVPANTEITEDTMKRAPCGCVSSVDRAGCVCRRGRTRVVPARRCRSSAGFDRRRYVGCDVCGGSAGVDAHGRGVCRHNGRRASCVGCVGG